MKNRHLDLRGGDISHISRHDRFIIEVRDTRGKLDFEKEKVVREQHPYLFQRDAYSLDDLLRYVSFGQGRDKPISPKELPKYLKDMGVTARRIYWR